MITEPTVAVEQIEVFADDLDARKAAAIYQEHGCLVVRGLMKPYLAELHRDIEASAAQSIAGATLEVCMRGIWKRPRKILRLCSALRE